MVCKSKFCFIALNMVLMLSGNGMNVNSKSDILNSKVGMPCTVNSRSVSLDVSEGMEKQFDEINKAIPLDKHSVEIFIKDGESNMLLKPEVLTMKGMPCTQNIINKFGRGFSDLVITYMTTVRGMPKEQFYKMLVTADITAVGDEKNGTDTIFDSSFGNKFWKLVNKAGSYSNIGGTVLTEAISLVFLLAGGKCTLDNISDCKIPVSSEVSSSDFAMWQILGREDVLKYLGISAALVYNIADNVALKIHNYANDKYTQYALIDNVESYMSLAKNFRNDGGNINALSMESKFGDVDGIDISEEFFNKYGPLFTEATREVLNERYKEFREASYVNKIKRESTKEDALGGIYKKMNAYRWISEILYPVSGLTTLIASCSLTVSLGAEEENLKWWSQCVSTIAIPTGMILGKIAKFFENLSDSSAKDYMIYAYYGSIAGNTDSRYQEKNGRNSINGEL